MNQPNAAPRVSAGAPEQSLPGLKYRLIERIWRATGSAPIALEIGDGPSLAPAGVSPVATVAIPDFRTLGRIAADPEFAFAEEYAAGRVQVRGDLVRFLETVYDSYSDRDAEPRWYRKLAAAFMKIRQDNTLQGARQNIHKHYDLGNDFYRLWLDRQMVYSCAYFDPPESTLEEAQDAKMDYLCRKLQLQPGETVVEIGCGWGALALFMARNYGARVKAFNISREQLAHARERARQEGLSGQVEFIEGDYRHIPAHLEGKRAEALVSVGMLEHVGPAHYPEYGRVIHECIGDHGRGLLQWVGRSHQGELSRWIRKRIFPGAYAPALQQIVEALDPWGFSIGDVENLRSHYAKTLEEWLARFEKSSQQVGERYGAWFERAWRLYLAGSVAAFRTGSLQLFQTCFAGSKYRREPWTRAPLYAHSPSLRGTIPNH